MLSVWKRSCCQNCVGGLFWHLTAVFERHEWPKLCVPSVVFLSIHSWVVKHQCTELLSVLIPKFAHVCKVYLTEKTLYMDFITKHLTSMYCKFCLCYIWSSLFLIDTFSCVLPFLVSCLQKARKDPLSVCIHCLPHIMCNHNRSVQTETVKNRAPGKRISFAERAWKSDCRSEMRHKPKQESLTGWLNGLHDTSQPFQKQIPIVLNLFVCTGIWPVYWRRVWSCATDLWPQENNFVIPLCCLYLEPTLYMDI